MLNKETLRGLLAAIIVVPTTALAQNRQRIIAYERELYDEVSLWEPIILLSLALLFFWKEEGTKGFIGTIIGLAFWVLVVALPFYGLSKYSGTGFLVGLGVSVFLLGLVWYKAKHEK